MKLDRWLSSAFAVSALALACGCSTANSVPPKAAAPVVSDAAAITQLMSAQLPGPVPKVGKSHVTPGDDDLESSSTAAEGGDVDAPKEARRDHGSRRSGSFGTTK